MKKNLDKIHREYKKAETKYKEVTAKQKAVFKEFKKVANHLERMNIACDKAAAHFDKLSMKLGG